MAISLLNSRAQYDLDFNRVREFATDMKSLPRSLKINQKLTSRTAVVRTQEFLAVEELAKAANDEWQKAWKGCFRKIRELERNESRTSHCNNFFKITHSLISVKTTYDYENLLINQKKVF